LGKVDWKANQNDALAVDPEYSTKERSCKCCSWDFVYHSCGYL